MRPNEGNECHHCTSSMTRQHPFVLPLLPSESAEVKGNTRSMIHEGQTIRDKFKIIRKFLGHLISIFHLAKCVSDFSNECHINPQTLT